MGTSGVQSAESAAPRHYSAFISYTDANRVLAHRLQARLEHYKLPRRLAAQVGFDRIKPVFVDRAEMRAASDLDDAIRDALGRSDFLIVLCTPRTPASVWVGREIDLFRELRGGGKILAALFEGEKAESFHARLLADEGKEPLAADFRKHGDGERLALLKIVATLADVHLTDLIRRDARRRRQRMAWLGSGALAGALLVGALGFWGYSSSVAVDEGRIEASQAMERQLNELRERIKAGGTLDMAAALNREVELFYDQQAGSSQLPEVELGKAKLLHAKAEDEEKRGNLEEAAANAREAWLITSRVLEKRPDDPDAVFSHVQSAYWVGFAAWRQRDTPFATRAFALQADLTDRLVKLEPANDEYRLEQAYAYINLGALALREARDPARAKRYFEASQAAVRTIQQRRPGDPDTIYSLADGEAWLADVELERGNFAAARRHRAEQKRLTDILLEKDPRNLIYRLVNSSNQLGEAAVDSAQGLHRAALKKLQSAYAEAIELLATDPEHASLARRKRSIELLIASTELELAATDPGALRRAERLIGDCAREWSASTDGELPVYCSILASRAALMRGDAASARRLMADPRLDEWLKSPSLSPTWQLDFKAECRKLGDPGLCR